MTMSSTRRKKLCHFWDVQVQRKKKKKNCDLSSRRKGILKRRPCSHLHPPPSAIKHQSRKRLGKAFPTLPQRPPFCKKGQRESIANNARVDKWIGLLRCDMHSGSNKILIPPPRLKSLIFQGDVFGLGFEFCWGIPLRSTPVPQAGKPDCSPAWPQQGGKESWTPPWKLRCFFGRKPIQQSSWFQKSFSQLNTQMSKPLLKKRGLPTKCKTEKKMKGKTLS